VTDQQQDLAALRRLRRHMMVQTAVMLVIPTSILLFLWDARLLVPDAHVLAGIAGVLLSWVVVRTVADMATALETPCPECRESFFGGVSRAAFVLPVPPTRCVHCRIDFDGLRPWSGGSGY
jgi:hypothetical protein